MKALAWIVGVVTLVTAGFYTALSLARWEWSRALFFGLVFVAAEIGLATALVLTKLASLQHDLGTARPRRPSPATLDAIERGRGDHQRFRWLRPDPSALTSQTNVFITMVVGGGVLLSAGAWMIDRLASRTTDPEREARLGRQLASIEYRPGLVVDEVEALARPRPDREDPRLPPFLGRR